MLELRCGPSLELLSGFCGAGSAFLVTLPKVHAEAMLSCINLTRITSFCKKIQLILISQGRSGKEAPARRH